MKKDGFAVIDELDLLNYNSMPTTYDWGLMCELIKQGAPIIGRIDPKPDFQNYNWVVVPKVEGARYSWKYNWISKN